MSIFPPGALLPLQASLIKEGIDENLWYTSSTGQSKYYLKGGWSPIAPGIPGQDGIICKSVKGIQGPPFTFKDLQASSQDGVTWTETVYDPAKITFALEAHAATPRGLQAVIDEWGGAWDPRTLGTLEHITLDGGYWFCNPRLEQTWVDEIKYDRRYLWRPITHNIRIDAAFWYGPDSRFVFGPGNGSDFIQLSNIGTQLAWPRHLCYGPGTFAFGNGPGSTTMITFGPLLDGQIALLSTNPAIPVVDLTPGQPPALTPVQHLVEEIASFAFNGNSPPLVESFESLFGISPPQGPLDSLINGQFTNPVQGVAIPSMAVTQSIAVSISGGNSSSQVISALTPPRISPA